MRSRHCSVELIRRNPALRLPTTPWNTAASVYKPSSSPTASPRSQHPDYRLFIFCCAHSTQVIDYLASSEWQHSHGRTRTQRRRRSPLHLRAADGDVSDPRRLRPRTDQLFVAVDPLTKQLLHYDDHHTGDCVCLDKTLSVLVCSDMQDCYIDVCSPEVLSLFEDNFDYQHLRRHFVKAVLVDDIMGYKIFTHEIGSSYAARVDNFRSYDTVSKDIIQRWTYPYVPDISFSGNRALKVGRQGVYKACDVVQSRSADGCYIWNDVTIEDGCEIGNAIVCDGVKIRAGAVVQPGAVLSFNVVVGRGFVVPAYSKVSLLQQPATEDSDEELEYADSSSGTANHLETESKSSWLGPDEAGYIWEVCEGDHDEDWKHSVAPIPKDKLDEITQAMDDDDDLEDESVVPTSGELKSDADSINTDVNDPGDEYGYFEREVEGAFLRAVEEGIKVELGILEINSLRLSYNMESADCAGAIFYSMMKLAADSPHSSAKVIMKFEEMCQETARELGPLFAQILHVLYEKDVVQEDAILRWAEEKAGADEADKVYLQQCESFIQWLKEASEEEDEDDDDDEEDWLNCLLMDKNLAGDSTPRPKWRKVAYGGMQIGYNDNYTDETFLEEMVMNANVVRRDLLKVMKGSVSISQYLCIVALVVLVWVHTLESSRDENSLLLLDLSLLALGFLVLLLTEEKMLLLRYIANVSFFTTGLYVLAPVYQTLTRSISSDSIWAVTVSLLSLHLFLHDYSGSTIRAPGALKSPSLTSCISVNASVVASVFVASRLPSRRHVFAVMLFSLQVFLFAPLVTYCIKKFSFGLHLLFSFGLIYALHILFFVLFLVIVVVVNVVCPYWLIRMQEYKFEINGPWDEAKLCFYITD
ncbi:hypothetical protein F2Q69_00017337 [Brassica cretica]|uniref:W2 domain-containing protein n=1 Tax=Brassica cretica TaxID=69181 RepID=A0A8S9QV12_BRACR|nr:hypothetical protein F2Q69_00017337 [Brassica cretica]